MTYITQHGQFFLQSHVGNMQIGCDISPVNFILSFETFIIKTYIR